MLKLLVVTMIVLCCAASLVLAIGSPTDSLIDPNRGGGVATLEYAIKNEESEDEEVILSYETNTLGNEFVPVPPTGVVPSPPQTCVFDCSFFFIGDESQPACVNCIKSIKYTAPICYRHPESFADGSITPKMISDMRDLCSQLCQCVANPPTPGQIGLFQEVEVATVTGRGVQNPPPGPM